MTRSGFQHFGEVTHSKSFGMVAKLRKCLHRFLILYCSKVLLFLFHFHRYLCDSSTEVLQLINIKIITKYCKKV